MAAVLLVWNTAISRGQVLVFDAVTVENNRVQLKVRTLKWMLPAGGVPVAVRIGEESPKTILTGADGYGYMSVIPKKADLKMIHAVYAGGEDKGLLLVMAVNDEAVVVELENSFRQAVLTGEGMSEMKDAMMLLCERFRVIFLTRLLGLSISRKLLERFGMKNHPIVGFHGSGTFKSMADRGVKLHGIVASGAVLETGRNFFDRLLSFEKTTHGTLLETWHQVPRELGLGGHHHR